MAARADVYLAPRNSHLAPAGQVVLAGDPATKVDRKATGARLAWLTPRIGVQQVEDSPKRILLAEDEYLVRLLVKDDLEESGFVVLEAGHGLDAIAMLEDPGDVDLLVTNLRMPGADGIEVAIAARARHPDIPIIFISATPQHLTSPRTPIPHHLMSKPFDTASLVELVRTLLRPG